MTEQYKRRDFIKTAAVLGVGVGVAKNALGLFSGDDQSLQTGTRVGIIGLDTSHSIAFAKTLNDPNAAKDLGGYKVVAAYPKGSHDIESSVSRIAGYTTEIEKLGVEIVTSIDDLIKKVDVVLLETNDGRLHLEQALPVLKAGKRMFIDKPVAASLADAFSIFIASKKYNVPIFSSSSLRYFENAQDIEQGKLGRIMGADTFSPATLEKTHSDLYWYGIHGVELLFTVMGTGCKNIRRTFNNEIEVVVGEWTDNRIGTFRGIRTGKKDYGGTVFGEKDILTIKPASGYRPLLVKIVQFFQTGIPPVSPQETLEIYTFMEAARVSSRKNGAVISLESVAKKL